MRRGGLALALTVALTAPALAREVPMTLHNAQVVPVSFAAMKGWRSDNHLAAYKSFMQLPRHSREQKGAARQAADARRPVRRL